MGGTAELLLSFVAAFEHVPPHRRLKLYSSLARTLGEGDSLFALFAMLANRYPEDERVDDFVEELAGQFGADIRLNVSGSAFMRRVILTIAGGRKMHGPGDGCLAA